MYTYYDKNIYTLISQKSERAPAHRDLKVAPPLRIDNEVPSLEKCYVQNCESDHSFISCLLNSKLEKDRNSRTDEHDCIKDVSSTKKPVFDSQRPVLSDSVSYRSEQENKQAGHEAILPASMFLFAERSASKTNGKGKQLAKTENIAKTEDGKPGSLAKSRQSSIGLHDHSGSFGLMPHSGSVSLRSNSSSASTQSFAFPVLPSEWIETPIRMTEADRRHLRKRRQWSTFFICCKF